MANSRTEFQPRRLLEILKRFPCKGAYRAAFSGGADSSALLHALSELGRQLPRPVQAIHVHHGYHADADEWESHCQAFCRQREIDLRCVRVAPNLASGRGPEAELRHQRYRAFEQMLEPGDLLLLAHHSGDQAETVLLNLMRGSGVEGLAGMPETRPLGRGSLARPLLHWSRVELVAYLQAAGVTWLEDPGNLDESPDRNFLRLRILPELRSRWPATDRAILRSADHCREAWGLLREHGEETLRKHLLIPRVMQLAPDLYSDPARLKLALRLWIEQAGAPSMPGARLEEYVRQLRHSRPEAVAEMAWSGWRMRRYGNRLWLQEDAAVRACPERQWEGDTRLDLGAGIGSLAVSAPVPALFDKTVTVGPRSEGAALALGGGRRRQSVKELMRAARVPPWLRCSIPVLSRGNEVLAVGDWLLSPRLEEWLSRHGARLLWAPGDAVLEFLRSECHGTPVDPARSLG